MTRGFSVQNPLFGIVWFRRHPLRWLIIVLHRCLLVYPSINNSRVSKQFTAPWLPSKYSTYLFVGKYAFCKWLIDPRATSTRDIDLQFSYIRAFRRHLFYTLSLSFPFLSFLLFAYLRTDRLSFPLFSYFYIFSSLISNLTSNVKNIRTCTVERSLKQNKVFKTGPNDSSCLEKSKESIYRTAREKDFGKVSLLEPRFPSVVYALKISSDKKIVKTFTIVRVCSQFWAVAIFSKFFTHVSELILLTGHKKRKKERTKERSRNSKLSEVKTPFQRVAENYESDCTVCTMRIIHNSFFLSSAPRMSTRFSTFNGTTRENRERHCARTYLRTYLPEITSEWVRLSSFTLLSLPFRFNATLLRSYALVAQLRSHSRVCISYRR